MMKKITLKNRILSGILALVTLISLVPVQSWGTESAAEEQVTIEEASSLQVTRAGAKIRTIRLAAHERIEINAENGSAAASYQWQILHPHRENVWINIYDATHSYLFVTLALVRNMMTDDNIAILRCRVTEDEQVRYTDPVTVQFCPEQEYIPEPTPTEPPEAVMEPVLHPETTEPTVPETTAPAETEAPTIPETTAPAETEAPTVPETTAPAETEAPTVPETTAPAETEVPAVPETTAPAETLAPVVPETQPLMVEEILVELPAKQMEAAMAVAETAPAETEAPTEITAPVETAAPTTTEPVPMETNQDTEVDLSAADDSEIPDDNEFVSVTIEYIRYDFARDANGKMIAQPNHPEGWTDPKYRGGYLLEQEGRVAFNSYIATLQSGTDLNTTVPVPTMMGYDTYLNGKYEETVSTVPISLTNITQNVVYQVEYLPAAVPYTVRYYFQNIYDDLYVENASLKVETTGHTGSTPPDTILKKEVDGFLSLYYQPDAIAADGSTVFEVYYERNYYLMEFDCTGGYGAETLYNRYGSYINVPNPVRSGYIFAGWDRMVKNSEGKYVNGDGVADPLPETMPLENTAYQAIWVTENTKYTVAYWLEHEDGTKSYLGIRLDSAMSGTYVSGNNDLTSYMALCNNTAHSHTSDCYVNDLSYMQYVRADSNVFVEGDGSTIVNVYYRYKEYKLRFYYARSYVSNNQTVYQIATNTGGSSNNGGTVAQATWSGAYTTQPTLNDKFTAAQNAGNATCGSVLASELGLYGAHTYYYIEINERYNTKLKGIWPSAWINELGGNKFISWGTQYGSGYHTNNANKNIKGTYERLDANIIRSSDNADGTNHFLVAYWNITPSYYQYNIYYEALDEMDYDKEYGGKKYKLETTEIVMSTDDVAGQSALSFEGVTCVNSKAPQSENLGNGQNDNPIQVNFYYTRNPHKLYFWNYNQSLSGGGHGIDVVYGEALESHGEKVTVQNMNNNTVPGAVEGETIDSYPEGLEPGAYEFIGWYTTPLFDETTAVDWENDTVPDSDVTFYARWEPIKRNVTFYTFYSDIGLEAGDEGYNADWMPFLTATNVPHGSILGTAYNEIPSDRKDAEGNLVDTRIQAYDFIGWFYLDEDNKKRFAPDTMEITRDLVRFAEWKTEIDTTYEVRYVLRGDVGTENTLDGKAYSAGDPVADVNFAHSSVGKTKTFNAKALGDLYPAFQAKFFPITNSHSILMQEDASQNTYTFEYVFDDTVYYKVRYLEAGTNKVLLNEDVKSTEEAVVTEKFKPKAGYIPQSYYIRKTLAYDGTATENTVIEENVITFYYVKDTTHGVYSVEYYLENENSTDSTNPDNYTQYESIVGVDDLKDANGNAKTFTAQVRNYEGYEHVPSLNTVITYDENNNEVEKTGADAGDPPHGTINVNGLTIKLYYKRNQYPYIIEYREYGAAADTAALKIVVDGDLANFDSQITYVLTQDTAYDHTKNTIVIDGKVYQYYIADPTEADITKSITIRAFDEGETNPNKMVFYFVQKQVEVHYEVVEQESAVTGLCRVSMKSERSATADNLSGSSAMPAEGFQFIGWYRNEACEDEDRIEDPSWLLEEGKKLKPQTLDTTQDDIYYYALFEPVDLTVTYDAKGGEPVEGQTSRIGETVTLPTTTRDGYTLTGWWYDANGDGKIDAGEEYAPGGSFTMPGKNVHFVAQWIDSRMDNKHKVFVGLNMSFYNSGHEYYYQFPKGEPTIVNLEAARAYIASIDANGKNTWAVQEGYWDKALCKPGVLGVDAEPSDYIDPAILNPGTLTTNGNVIGVFDETGTKTKALLYFTENDYKAIVQAWLDARDYFKSRFASYNINWDLLPMDASLYEAVPYVIKRHYHGLTDKDDWFIDFVILPKNRFKVTYNLALPDGYTDTAPVDENLYGQGMYVNVKEFHDVPYTADNRYVAKFVGWTAKDKDGNQVGIDSNTNKFTMPGSDVTLTAQWEFCAPLTISQTGMNGNESSLYRITGNGVDLTVAITGNDQVTILDLPLGVYTVTEQTNWSWTSKSEAGKTVQTVTLKMPADANAGADNNPAIFNNTPKTVAEYRWLHGEASRDNKFAAVN